LFSTPENAGSKLEDMFPSIQFTSDKKEVEKGKALD
jgi:hypothetical protein